MSAQAATRNITGRLVGYNGAPMRLAEVHAGETTVTADLDGRYLIEVPDADIARIAYSGVDHATLEVPIIDHGDIALDVRLGTLGRDQPVQAVELLVYAPGKRKAQRRLPMQRRSDGTFAVEVTSITDQLSYKLSYLGTSHSVNGTQSDGFAYDGSDYQSHIAAGSAAFQIHFDPRMLPPAARPPSMAFSHASHAQIELAEILRELADTTEATAAMAARKRPARTARAEQARSTSPALPGEAALPNGSAVRSTSPALPGEAALPNGSAVRSTRPAADGRPAWLTERDRKLAGERDPIVRGALLISPFAGPPEDRRLMRPGPIARIAQIVTEVPATSELWTLWPRALASLVKYDDAPATCRYVERAALAVRDKSAMFTLLILGNIAKTAGRSDDVTRIHDELLTSFSDSELAARLAIQLDPESKIRVGRPMPAYDLHALGDPAGHITPDTLRGKLVLFDNWASWCGPCVHEMSVLHEAYRAFHDRGLEIVSINIDESAETVAGVRAKRWPMPWRHAAGDKESAVLFEMIGVPELVLVDAAGTIIAVGDDLRGARLAPTIEAALTGAALPVPSTLATK